MSEMDDLLSQFSQQRQEQLARNQAAAKVAAQEREVAAQEREVRQAVALAAVQRFCRSLEAAEHTDRRIQIQHGVRGVDRQVPEHYGFRNRKIRMRTERSTEPILSPAWYVGIRDAREYEFGGGISVSRPGRYDDSITVRTTRAMVYLPDRNEARFALSRWQESAPKLLAVPDGPWIITPQSDNRLFRREEEANLGDDDLPLGHIENEMTFRSFVHWLDNELLRCGVPWVD